MISLTTSRPCRSAASRIMCRPGSPSPLKGVRRSARLECASAQDSGAQLGHAAGDRFNLIGGLHRARPRRNDDFLAADAHAVREANQRAFRAKRAARQLVRLRDAHDFAHAGQHFDVARVKIRTDADCAHDRVRFAGRAMNVESQRHQPVDHVLDLLFACSGLHQDNHEIPRSFSLAALFPCSAYRAAYSPAFLASSCITARSTERASSKMRSNRRRIAAPLSGPRLARSTPASTSRSRSGW